jgi:hypothetical protein
LIILSSAVAEQVEAQQSYLLLAEVVVLVVLE